MIGKKIDRDRLMKEMLDASLKEGVAPAEEAPQEGEIKADKKAAVTPKNAAAYAAPPPLQGRETDFNAGIVVFFAEWVRHFPSLQKELELTDEQREQLFPKLDAIFPAGRTIARQRDNGRQRAQRHQGDTASATVRACPGTCGPTGGGKRVSLAETAKSLQLSRRQQEEIRALCDDSRKEITEQIKGIEKTAREHQPGSQELLEMSFSNSDACLKKRLQYLRPNSGYDTRRCEARRLISRTSSKTLTTPLRPTGWRCRRSRQRRKPRIRPCRQMPRRRLPRP